MTNTDIVKLFRNVAAALTIKNENRFRIIAYDKAADSIEHLTQELKDIWEQGKLEEVPGIGKTIADYLNELFKTGEVAHFKSVFDGISPAIFEFLLIPGIGPKKAYRLTQEFKIDESKGAVEKLKKAAEDGRIAEMEGFGEKSQTEILSSIETYKKGQIKENRMPLPYADKMAQEVIDYLLKHPKVKRVDRLGSLRRKVATIGDIDLALVTNDGQEVVTYFTQYPEIRKIIDQGPKGATILLKIGRQVDLRVQTENTYGAMLQYFTGSKHHNITLREYALRKGLSLSEHGIKNVKTGEIEKIKTEEEFYKKLGMPYIPPEIREDRGEIIAAIAHKVPQLVETKDIKGDLHIHSNYDLHSSHDMGSSALSQLLDHAAQLKYEYIGISDHNPRSMGEDTSSVVGIMKKRYETFQKEHEKWQKKSKHKVSLFVMLETDIQPSGKLALPEEAFEYIDAAIISVHSSFKMDKVKMTERILSAFAHPKARILAHPTGRLIGEREGYEVDWPKLFEFAAKEHKAIEINAWYQRLDLPDLLVREAIKRGVKLVINTDTHATEHMDNMQYGVDVARRGWSEKKDILNTLGYNEFKKWLVSS